MNPVQWLIEAQTLPAAILMGLALVALAAAKVAGLDWPGTAAKQSCISCRFFGVGVQSQGTCMRFPPARVYTGDTTKVGTALDVTVWPVVRDDNWCGEYRKK